jgi:hypothetical protein
LQQCLPIADLHHAHRATAIASARCGSALLIKLASCLAADIPDEMRLFPNSARRQNFFSQGPRQCLVSAGSR